jgi:hypothetical protein
MPAKGLIRMLRPRGNPQARNPLGIIGFLQRQPGVELHVASRRAGHISSLAAVGSVVGRSSAHLAAELASPLRVPPHSPGGARAPSQATGGSMNYSVRVGYHRAQTGFFQLDKPLPHLRHDQLADEVFAWYQVAGLE